MFFLHNKHQKLYVVMLVIIFILIGIRSAQAILYTPWYDVNKYWTLPSPDGTGDTSDSKMCWAATASNILMYTGWGLDYDGNGMIDPRLDIYQDFLDHFPNAVGWGTDAFQYYIGAHYSTLNWTNYFREENMSNQMLPSMDKWLVQGYGIFLAIDTFHSITAWGYETDPATGVYNKIYITDSDDNKLGWTGLQPYNVSLHADNKWYIDNYAFGTVEIGKVLAFRPVPVPEPSTMLLLGSGLVGLFGLGRKRLFNKG